MVPGNLHSLTTMWVCFALLMCSQTVSYVVYKYPMFQFKFDILFSEYRFWTFFLPYLWNVLLKFSVVVLFLWQTFHGTSNITQSVNKEQWRPRKWTYEPWMKGRCVVWCILIKTNNRNLRKNVERGRRCECVSWWTSHRPDSLKGN